MDSMGKSGKTAPTPLPRPETGETATLRHALAARRSVRSYSQDPLQKQQLSELLFAAQGTTHPQGYRTAPSAGALYPLEILVAASRVRGVESGVHQYLPREHALSQREPGDKRQELYEAGLNQFSILEAPACIVISAVFERMAEKYGNRAPQYVYVEAGCAAQNIALQCTVLSLGTVVIGAFYEDRVGRALGSPKQETPVLIMPVGQLKV